MRPVLIVLAAAILATGLCGCIVYDAASTTVGAATTVVSTGVSVTGDVVGAAADTVTGGSKSDNGK